MNSRYRAPPRDANAVSRYSDAHAFAWNVGTRRITEQNARRGVFFFINAIRLPQVSPLAPWEWPGRTWHRIHIDYAGSFEGRMLLIIVDAHSKFIDAHIVSSATTSVTLTKLRQTFSFAGLPHIIVSNNGSCFTSEEFDDKFCRANSIKHVRCSPYHPSINGAAESSVQT